MLVYQRVSMEIWGFFNGTNIYIWNYVCFEWKYQGNKQIMEISMDIYGNINRMNGNIQRHHGDIMRISYGDFWEYCRRF
jgi:hypothetical protein